MIMQALFFMVTGRSQVHPAIANEAGLRVAAALAGTVRFGHPVKVLRGY
jgi:hypothetical protein